MIKYFFQKIKNRILFEKKRFELWIYLKFPLGKKIYFIGTPEHGNIGDSAISIAEMNFAEKFISHTRIKEITKPEYLEDRAFIRRIISKKALICGHGGGNIGNQWYGEELLRYMVLSDLPQNKTIIFPQTAYFTNDQEGKLALKKSYDHYDAHTDLTIVAREQASFDLLNRLYSKPKLILTPDIVLSSVKEDYRIQPKERKGALLVFRSDPEKVLSDENIENIKALLSQKNISYTITDTYSTNSLTKETRLKRVQDKLNEFISSEIVITDRLHGMVFAAITETPCIVFSNYNHKVKGTYEWIKHLPYIKFIEDFSVVDRAIPELLNMKNCRFDNRPILDKFNELSEMLRRYVN